MDHRLAARSPSLSVDPASGGDRHITARWQEFVTYVGDHDYNQEQATALLQLAVQIADPGSARKGARLEWQNIYAAIATLTRTDSQILHARLTIGFSPAEFKWMLQNKELYTWHSSPVRFQRCLQCMVAKLGQCGSNAEKTCWSCRSRLTDAPAGAKPSSGNTLRPPRHIALTMAKTAANRPVGQPELDAHISMYDQAKWPLTKRDQTYLSQANKFWSFISTDAFLGISDRRQLLDLTDRACTKRYILYMHKMNKRGNLRAALDLHCLGLTYPQPHAANPAQASDATEAELNQQLSQEAAAYAASLTSRVSEPFQLSGPEAAGHLVPGTLSGPQVSAEAAERPSPSGRYTRLQSGFGAADAVAEAEQSPSAGKHDWVNLSESLLATLRGELDLEQRDALAESDEAGSSAGPTKKCRPWHWLKEMRQFGYERQVMPKDQIKKRKRAAMSTAGAGPAAATFSHTAPQELLQPPPSRTRMQQQAGFDSESSNEDSPGQNESQDVMATECTKRHRLVEAVGSGKSLLSHVHPFPPSQPPQPPTLTAQFPRDPSQLWSGLRKELPMSIQHPPLGFSSATAAEAPPLGFDSVTAAEARRPGSSSAVAAEAPRLGFGSPIAAEALPLGFSSATTAEAPPLDFGLVTAAAAPPLGFSSATAAEAPPRGFSSATAAEASPLGFVLVTAAAAPPLGFNSAAAAEAPPRGFSSAAMAEAPPLGFSSATAAEAPPPGFGSATAAEAPPPGFSSATAAEATLQGFSSAATAEAPPLPFGPESLSALSLQLGIPDLRQGLQTRPILTGSMDWPGASLSSQDRHGAVPSGPAAAVPSLDLPFLLPLSSSMSSSLLPASSLRSTFDMEIGLPPAQGSLQATGDSLHQRYFPAAPSAFGNPLFTPAAPTQHPDMRAPWPSLNQGANSNSPFGVPYTHPAPHFSPHPSSNFHWGEAWALNRVQTPQVPTMAHMHQRDQSQTSVVGMTQPQLEQDGFRHLPKPFG